MPNFKPLSVFISVIFLGNIFAQANFAFEDLIYMIDGKDLGTNEVPVYENINVGVKDIQGYLIEDEKVELGMEVVITDVNSNRLLFSPDMMEGIRLSEDEVKTVQFDLNLNEDFRKGEEYFIKIKVWDKRTSKSYSKHSSFKVVEGLRNDHVYIDVRRLNVAGYKFFLDRQRLYKSNYVRKGNEVVTDLFFTELEIEKGEDIVILTEIIDEQNSKTIKLKNEHLIEDKTEDLKSVLVRTFFDDENLIPGNSYIYNLQFHNASRNQKLDMKFRFNLLPINWEENGVKSGGIALESSKNKIKTKPNVTVEIGDRLDFTLLGFESKQLSDFGFGKIGGVLQVRDAKGKLFSSTKDLFSELGPYPLTQTDVLNFDYVIPSSLASGSKYTLEFKVWDKYSNAIIHKKFPFKTAKVKEMPFGLQENLFLKCKFMDSKLVPISVYVSKNGYKNHSNNLRPLDEIDLISSVELKESYQAKELTRQIELFDDQGNLLTHDEELMEGFSRGEVIASLVIPEAGIEFNRNYRLIAYLTDGDLELMRVEYTFYIEQ